MLKKLLRRISFTAVFWLCLGSHGLAQNQSKAVLMSALIEEQEKNGDFSGTVLVAEGDSTLLIKSAGFADRETNKRNQAETKFNIASVGKLFTRILILKLISEGKLGFEDRVGKFFNGFKEEASLITIRHLLNHRSGLGDIYISRKYLKGAFRSPADVVALIAKEKPAFVPGSGNKYSNSGYYLLGAVISKITGMPLAEAMEERLFAPLEMTGTGFASTGELVPGHAVPYERKGSVIRRTGMNTLGEPPTGAGSQYSTAGDLFKLYNSIISDHKLLDEKSKAFLFNHFEPADWNTVLHSKKIVGYVGGDTRGWSAKLTFMFLEKKIYGVAILSNFDDMAHQMDLKLREVIGK